MPDLQARRSASCASRSSSATSRGRSCAGLKREDFAILEDDKPQAIEAFEFEDLPTERAPEPRSSPRRRRPLLRADAARRGAARPAARRRTESLGGRRLVVLLFDSNGMEPEQLAAGRELGPRLRRRAHDRLRRGGGRVDRRRACRCSRTSPADRAALRHALDRVVGTNDAADFAADPGSDAAADADAFSADTSELDLFNIDRRLRALEDLSKALAPVVQKKSVIYFSSGMSRRGRRQPGRAARRDRPRREGEPLRLPGRRARASRRWCRAATPARRARAAATSSPAARTNRQFDQQLASQDTLASLAQRHRRPRLPRHERLRGRLRARRPGQLRLLRARLHQHEPRAGRQVPPREGPGWTRPELRVEHRSGYYADRDFRHAGHEDRERQLAGPAARRPLGDRLPGVGAVGLLPHRREPLLRAAVGRGARLGAAARALRARKRGPRSTSSGSCATRRSARSRGCATR